MWSIGILPLGEKKAVEGVGSIQQNAAKAQDGAPRGIGSETSQGPLPQHHRRVYVAFDRSHLNVMQASSL
jgi:hypothetical protein